MRVITVIHVPPGLSAAAGPTTTKQNRRNEKPAAAKLKSLLTTHRPSTSIPDSTSIPIPIIAWFDASPPQFPSSRSLHPKSQPHDPTIRLADELLLGIISHVSDTASLGAVAQVCRRWNRVLDDEPLWRDLCASKRFAPLLRQTSSNGTGWASKLDVLMTTMRDNDRDGDDEAKDYVPRLRLACRHWKRIYRDNHLTNVNWKRGRYRVRTVGGEPGGRSFHMQFDDSWVVSVASGGAGKVWDMDTGECHFRLGGHNGTISAVKLDRRWLVTGGIDSMLKIWDTSTGLCVRTLVGHTGEIVTVQHSEETVVSGSEDTTIRIWDLETGECRQVLEGHDGAVCCLQFDDRVVISGSTDNHIKIWTRYPFLRRSSNDLSTLNPPEPPSRHSSSRTLHGHRGAVFCLQFSGRYICSGAEDAEIRLWRRSSGECLRTLKGHAAAVVCLQFDDVKIVSGGSDMFVKVWDISTGECLYTLAQHTAAVWNLKFSGTRLTTSSFDRSLRVWDFGTQEDEDRQTVDSDANSTAESDDETDE
ncbi:hypothetical protein HKX48_001691 [Thoreauomyces humboldtii]|nr:hypothetical protein HKX48_001691 [Thoreauomyces humboldtii]